MRIRYGRKGWNILILVMGGDMIYGGWNVDV